MNISELEKFKIEDAINFHDELNPLLFDKNNKLKPNIKKQLEIITDDFIEYMGIPDLAVEDVIITGSNVAFTYTPHSDIDLHLLVDFAELPESDVYKELFNAKKSLYNDTYEITIRDIPVELYVQDTAQAHTSLGEYSLMQDKFTRFPSKQRANLDEISAEHKFERLEELCIEGLKSKDIDKVNNVLSIIKRYRQAGLDKKGEFGPENLAFKAIRSKGYFQALFDLRNKLRGEQLSIEEEMFRRTFEESIGVYNSKVNIAEGEDGVEQLAKQFNMKNMEVAKYVDQAVKFEMELSNKDKGDAYKLALRNLSKDIEYYDKMVKFISAIERLNKGATNDGKGSDPNDISQMTEAEIEMAYALYVNGKPTIKVNTEEEAEMYIKRFKQRNIPGPFEIKYMNFGKKRTSQTIGEASGYIPSEAQKNDPRFSYALTVDVHPDTMKKQAKAMGLGDIQRDGRPPLVRPGKKKTKNPKTQFGKGIY